jgi:hypothetical protein
VGPRADLDTMDERKVSCPCRESNFSFPARSLVAISIELFRRLIDTLKYKNRLTEYCSSFVDFIIGASMLNPALLQIE